MDDSDNLFVRKETLGDYLGWGHYVLATASQRFVLAQGEYAAKVIFRDDWEAER